VRSDDRRAWRFWLINRDSKNWKIEHVRTEISGIDGAPISISQTPFQVNLTLSGPDQRPEDFKIIDHLGEHRESATSPDPYIKPKQDNPKNRQTRSQSGTREGQDARRLFRVAVRQMEMRAELSNDPMLIAAVYDALEKLRDTCPRLFEE